MSTKKSTLKTKRKPSTKTSKKVSKKRTSAPKVLAVKKRTSSAKSASSAPTMRTHRVGMGGLQVSGIADVKKWFIGLFGSATALALVIWAASEESKRVDHRHSVTLEVVEPVEPSAAPTALEETAPVVETDVVKHDPTPVPFQKHENLEKELARQNGSSRSARIIHWSELFAKVPEGNPLLRIMEEPKIQDRAPALPKKFDCTTFVETVAALARSKDSNDFFAELYAVRYKDGDPRFINRNHFPELDWIPNNQKAGYLDDITTTVAKNAGADTAEVTKKIDKARWLKTQMETGRVERTIASHVESDWNGTQEASIRYVPFDQVARVVRHIPDGTVMNLVRANEEKFDVLVSHQGFVVTQKGDKYFRHVDREGNIKTVRLLDYMADQKKNRWPVLGLNFVAFK